ncbi:MAG: RNA polymerase sigma-70 factor [Tangfeifania sp.]
MAGQEEHILFEKIKKGNEKAFERLFCTYYSHLCLFAEHFVRNQAEAEEIVQDVFVRLWENRKRIAIATSVRNYLFRSVKNRCLNFIQHKKIETRYAEKFLKEAEQSTTDDTGFIESGLLSKIEESIKSMPEKRQEIFRLSREEGLKYREIAEKLNISIKTVETHMGLAIKTLRNKLQQFTSFILFHY